jgi:hypothetical protein
MSRGAVPRTLTIAVALVSLLAAGCGGGSATGSSPSPSAVAGARPSSPAKITIISPRNGQTVHGSVLHVKLSLENARIVRPTSRHITPTTGHIHLYLDNEIVSMNYQLDNTTRVTPGPHAIRVEFVASDHLPFNPRVIATAAFEVIK